MIPQAIQNIIGFGGIFIVLLLYIYLMYSFKRDVMGKKHS